VKAWPWLVLCSCAAQSWTLPQPSFSVTHPATAWGRALKATQVHCGGVDFANEFSGVLVGPWKAWNTAEGLILAQCIVTLLRGDEQRQAVRITFASRRCPLSPMDDLPNLAKTCEVADLVPEPVKNDLVRLADGLEADMTRVN
jgi:hypothetical protein